MDSESKMWDRLFRLLAEDDDRQTVYGYRLDRFGKAMKPYLFRWYMHEDLLEIICHQYGPGEYRLRIDVPCQVICLTASCAKAA